MPRQRRSCKNLLPQEAKVAVPDVQEVRMQSHKRR
jgi:hypothetical protein